MGPFCLTGLGLGGTTAPAAAPNAGRGAEENGGGADKVLTGRAAVKGGAGAGLEFGLGKVLLFPLLDSPPVGLGGPGKKVVCAG